MALLRRLRVRVFGEKRRIGKEVFFWENGIRKEMGRGVIDKENFWWGKIFCGVRFGKILLDLEIRPRGCGLEWRFGINLLEKRIELMKNISEVLGLDDKRGSDLISRDWIKWMNWTGIESEKSRIEGDGVRSTKNILERYLISYLWIRIDHMRMSLRGRD